MKIIFFLNIFFYLFQLSNCIFKNFNYFENILNQYSQSFNGKNVFNLLNIPKRNILNEYDFIIVGAGPAGCVLANRLSERSDWNILLVEAGDRENIFHYIPALVGYFPRTNSNWKHYSTIQNNSCWGMNDNRCALPHGKLLGGSSSINYMIYNRGNRKDFDKWVKAGNIGWSYEEVLPYFKKSEMANLNGLNNSPYHNKYGLLSVEDVPYRTKTVNKFIKACKEYGIKYTDYNGETQIGVSYVQATTLKGSRHSAANAYLKNILKRKNLHILINTYVTKIHINEITKIAYAIEFINNNKKYIINAKNEIILSAGSFNSPQLLMLSGIGPEEHLKELNIKIIKNSPVGKIMYDHICHLGPTFILNTTKNTLKASDLNIKDTIQYLSGYGKLTMIGGVEALAFIKTKNSKESNDLPDFELIYASGSLASDDGTGLKISANIRDNIYNDVYKPLEFINYDTYTTLLMLFHPKSYGYLKLKSNNPYDLPIINPNYLDNNDDIETLLEAIKISINISKTITMQKYNTHINNIPLPNCKNYEFQSDDYWRCSIRTLTYTLHHQVATCKMGKSNDETAVVSPELKVYGINSLRVVDTSIIPMPPTSHTNAMSFMIGEKAADLIKNEWLLK